MLREVKLVIVVDILRFDSQHAVEQQWYCPDKAYAQGVCDILNSKPNTIATITEVEL